MSGGGRLSDGTEGAVVPSAAKEGPREGLNCQRRRRGGGNGEGRVSVGQV